MTKEQVRLELQKIATANGGVLVPEHVVEAARDENHPLHKQFEWDDEEAARAWRIEQARGLIRSVTLKVHTETVTVDAPFYVRDARAAGNAPGYSSLPRIRDEAQLARETITAEWERVKASLERVRAVAVGVGLDEDARRASVLLRMFEAPSESAEAVTAEATAA